MRHQRWQSLKRGKKTSNKMNKCDMCGAAVSEKNTNYINENHIRLCNACRNRKEERKAITRQY